MKPKQWFFCTWESITEGREKHFQLEQCAYNDATFWVPDEQGYRPNCQCILESSNENEPHELGKCFNTTLDVQNLCQELEKGNEAVVWATTLGVLFSTIPTVLVWTDVTQQTKSTVMVRGECIIHYSYTSLPLRWSLRAGNLNSSSKSCKLLMINFMSQNDWS